MPYWKLYYHFIWGTKNRLPLIGSSLEPELYRTIAAKVQALDGFVHAIGGMEGHAHLAVSIPPKLAPAKFIGNVKGKSSHYVNHVIKLGLIGRSDISKGEAIHSWNPSQKVEGAQLTLGSGLWNTSKSTNS